jgi:hypothetical protein
MEAGRAAHEEDRFVTPAATLESDEVARLVSEGVLVMDGEVCLPAPMARGWVRRQLVETETPFASQHRIEVRRVDGTVIDLAESPLARLAVPASGEVRAFLEPHQVEAGERVRRLCERARLQPRVTMSYSAAHTAGGKGSVAAADISDAAADARKRLADIPRMLPADCAGVVIDVCGLLKGLQTVETERGWPRRSAKLVLRIGLDQLAQHYGLSREAIGPEARRTRHWLGDGSRPHRFE